MKKVLFLAVALLLTALVGCGKEEPNALTPGGGKGEGGEEVENVGLITDGSKTIASYLSMSLDWDYEPSDGEPGSEDGLIGSPGKWGSWPVGFSKEGLAFSEAGGSEEVGVEGFLFEIYNPIAVTSREVAEARNFSTTDISNQLPMCLSYRNWVGDVVDVEKTPEDDALLPLFALLIDGEDQMLLTPKQSSAVSVETLNLYWQDAWSTDRNYSLQSKVLVPFPKHKRAVRFTDGTEGYVPDSVMVPAYPVAGEMYRSLELNGHPKTVEITSIDGGWFSVESNLLDCFEEITPDVVNGSDRLPLGSTYQTIAGVSLQSVLYAGDNTYRYEKHVGATNLVPAFSMGWDTPIMPMRIEVKPNTTGKSRSFTLIFPNFNQGVYVYYTVTQE